MQLLLLLLHLSGFGETLTTAAPVSPGGSGGTRQITTVPLHDSDLDETVTFDQPSPSLTLLAENDAKSPPPGAVTSPLCTTHLQPHPPPCAAPPSPVPLRNTPLTVMRAPPPPLR